MNPIEIRKLLLAACFLGCFIVADSTGQEPSELLRKYPPDQLTKNQVDNELASIKWQLKQHAAVQVTYRKSRDEIAAKLQVLEAKIEDLNKSLPTAVRFLDDRGRSAMANLAMEQLLESRLELVSLRSLITQLEANLGKDEQAEDEVRKMETEMQRKAAESRLQFAKSDYDEKAKLAQQGSVSNQTLKRTRMELEIAEAEYAIAAKKAQLAGRVVSVDIARRLSEVRVEVEPVQAKIRALEEFLETLHQASESIGKIQRLQREVELWQKDLAMVANALFETSQKSIELRTFQKLVDDEREKAASKASTDDE